MRYRIGTRKSRLATVQAEWVVKELTTRGLRCDLVFIESEGDRNLSDALYQIQSEPGLFTKQLEKALLQNEIDLAVHSLKDLPTIQPPELKVSSIPAREETSDVLIVHPSSEDASLPLGLKRQARVGTSSLRRESQLLALRPDVTIIPIRGNVPTRVEQVREAKIDAVVLAGAGLNRLQQSFDGLRKQTLGPDHFVPAPGQGALALETRRDVPAELARALDAINDAKSVQETRIERTILRALEGGCTLPLGVRCASDGKQLVLNAFLGVETERGQIPRVWKSFHHFDISDASEETLVRKTVDYFKGILNG